MSRALPLAALVLLFVSASPSVAQDRPAVDRERFGKIDEAVKDAVAKGSPPGAVVLVLHRGEVVYKKAVGSRSKQPAETPMTEDTLFDLASLTKPIATATAVMLLVEQGKLRLSDRASDHWRAFKGNGKEDITLLHLLTHTSGLIADNALADYAGDREKSLENICKLTLQAAPGEKFIYSDVGFIVLGEIVARVSGQPLDAFCKKHVFEPLGMKATGFNPAAELRKRAAPTEQREGRWMQGEVHDPRSYRLGGVAGHAGLFSTADDLAIHAKMLLSGGKHNGKQFLAPSTVRLMTEPRPVPGGWRTCGWDMATSYSANRGEVFPKGVSFGHTGFTGTSIWLDPDSDTAVIFLSNRVHPDGKGNVNRLRGQVATFAASAVTRPDDVRHGSVLTGIDVLVRESFAPLKGRKVGLVTNHTGRDREGRSTIDLLHGAPGVKLVALFSPEHGIRGAVDEKVGDSKDEKTGLPIYSLYGERRKPTPETLKDIDTLVYDIQDAGCRFYTYISTLGLVMEAAAENKIRVVVLDRPNPINGRDVEGPILDTGKESFVAFHRLPVRHGMTVGELAKLFNAERTTKDGKAIRCELEVVRMEGWRRSDFYDRTGLLWVNPSPNLRNLTQAYLYPGIGLLETTNLSVGRGTDRPFEWFGAPWLDGVKLSAALNDLRLPGVRFVPMKLTPASSVFKGEACSGVNVIIDDWKRFRPLPTGMAVACELRRLYPEQWKVDRYMTLLGHGATLDGLKAGRPWPELEKAWQEELTKFTERRRAQLLYPE